MEELKNWGIMLIFISSGTLIYCFLLPSGNISKTAKTVLSICVLSLVCMPMFGVFSSFSDMDTVFYEPPEIEDYGDIYIESAKNATENLIKEIVRKYTSVPYKTEIFIDKTEDSSINIEYVGITFSAKPQHEKDMREALYDALLIIPDIKVELVSE